MFFSSLRDHRQERLDHRISTRAVPHASPLKNANTRSQTTAIADTLAETLSANANNPTAPQRTPICGIMNLLQTASDATQCSSSPIRAQPARLTAPVITTPAPRLLGHSPGPVSMNLGNLLAGPSTYGLSSPEPLLRLSLARRDPCGLIRRSMAGQPRISKRDRLTP